MPSQTDQAESNTIRSSRTPTRRDVWRRKPSTPARPPAGAARTNCRDSSDLGNKSREPAPRPRILNSGIPITSLLRARSLPQEPILVLRVQLLRALVQTLAEAGDVWVSGVVRGAR